MSFLYTNIYKVLADSSQVTVTLPSGSGSYSTGLPTVAASSDTLQTVLQIVFGIVGAVALLMIVISALQFVTSGGDPQAVAKARQAILFAAIGLVIAVSAEVIVTFVIGNV